MGSFSIDLSYITLHQTEYSFTVYISNIVILLTLCIGALEMRHLLPSFTMTDLPKYLTIQRSGKNEYTMQRACSHYRTETKCYKTKGANNVRLLPRSLVKGAMQ